MIKYATSISPDSLCPLFQRRNQRRSVCKIVIGNLTLTQILYTFTSSKMILCTMQFAYLTKTGWTGHFGLKSCLQPSNPLVATRASPSPVTGHASTYSDQFHHESMSPYPSPHSQIDRLSTEHQTLLVVAVWCGVVLLAYAWAPPKQPPAS